MGFHIDMTPLVDLMFLLLTFLMFTATFKSKTENDEKITVTRPQASADTTYLPEKDVAVIQVGIDKNHNNDTTLYFGLSNDKVKNEVWSMVPEIPDAFKAKAMIPCDTNLLAKLIRATLSVQGKTLFAVDADKRVRFEYVNSAMNVMRKTGARTFNYVTDKRKNND